MKVNEKNIEALKYNRKRYDQIEHNQQTSTKKKFSIPLVIKQKANPKRPSCYFLQNMGEN